MMRQARATMITRSADETKKIGQALGGLLKKGDVVLFLANLGAGKTTFIQGLARAFHITEGVFSPTFILAQSFPTRLGRKSGPVVHHMDFYRLTPKEILAMGAVDYLEGGGEIEKGVVLIEWAERCRELWPQERLEVRLKIKPRSTQRVVTLIGRGERPAKIVGLLKEKLS